MCYERGASELRNEQSEIVAVGLQWCESPSPLLCLDATHQTSNECVSMGTASIRGGVGPIIPDNALRYYVE